MRGFNETAHLMYLKCPAQNKHRIIWVLIIIVDIFFNLRGLLSAFSQLSYDFFNFLNSDDLQYKIFCKLKSILWKKWLDSRRKLMF